MVRAPELMHGKTSLVEHGGVGVLAGLPDPFEATRYHSLVVARDDLPATLEVTAETADGTIMGLRHRELAVEGVQFHPESILTVGGHDLLRNFLAQVEVACRASSDCSSVPPQCGGVPSEQRLFERSERRPEAGQSYVVAIVRVCRRSAAACRASSDCSSGASAGRRPARITSWCSCGPRWSWSWAPASSWWPGAGAPCPR